MNNSKLSILSWLLSGCGSPSSIDKVLEEYPYFHAAILAKIFQQSDNTPDGFLNVISSESILFPKRDILVNLYSDIVTIISKNRQKETNNEAKITLESMIREIQHKLSNISYELVSNKPQHRPYSLQVKKVEEPKLSETQIRKKELMEEFIKKSPTISRATATFFNPSESYYKPNIDADNIVSETLAIIYTKQGNIEKARDTYFKLIELYPQKEDYFNMKIKELSQ